jgi:hypothetical protein
MAKPLALKQIKVDIRAFNADAIALCETRLKPKQDSNYL